MSTAQDQGTGKHKHKSAEEPFPHTEKSEGGKQKALSEEHKPSSKAEPAKGKQAAAESKSESSGGKKEAAGSKSENGAASSQDANSDLKSREYTGPDGQIHHHTTKYAEQHK